MKRFLFLPAIFLICSSLHHLPAPGSWIRINQLGYTPGGIKVAVWCSKLESIPENWQLVDIKTNKIVYSGKPGKSFGAYGPFAQTCRMNFSSYTEPGEYYLQMGDAKSPQFSIGANAYNGAANFCLRYMRQQRSGFNPFLKDSCHTHDGYVLYGKKAGIPDSTYINVTGGWHDASDYLQYAATSANATYHLLMAYRDFREVFDDEKLANGLDGKNGLADVLDEAKWGLDWLLKMHPKENWMFNQVGDDRDHQGMRIPKEDSFYGRGFERPVYFVSGEPQQRGKFLNNTTGTSSTAGKFASAFALGDQIFMDHDTDFANLLFEKAKSAYKFGKTKEGVTQTASVRSPYIYAEENWTDDMELALASILQMELKNKVSSNENEFDELMHWSKQEQVTPWLGADTAKHYQWYPFINIGHYETAKQSKGTQRDTLLSYYKAGIGRVWNKAKQNAFFRGVPFIWCSNNLTTSFAIQCHWYRQLTGDASFSELEQANIDWLFGCNPWGVSFVYGLPAAAATPSDPHSAFTHLKNYPLDGALVDGPVYGSIYNNLIGITLYQPDEYAAFQSDLAVYHDDYGDYSTNEPTMDGTASLIYLLAACQSEAISRSDKIIPPWNKKLSNSFSYDHGAIVRGDSTKRQMAIVFTGDEFADGGEYIASVLRKEKIKASFFLTGRFYNNPNFQKSIRSLTAAGNFMGPHSNEHLLYCDWDKRDSLLVSRDEFSYDLLTNLDVMHGQGVNTLTAKYFLPPYEWFNDSIAQWTKDLGLQLINYTPGTISHADYTTPGSKNYKSSDSIYRSIVQYEQAHVAGLNGFILLMHIGTDPDRTDKFYKKLPLLISYLKRRNYQFRTVADLLKK